MMNAAQTGREAGQRAKRALVLASASPRRSEILKRAGISFEVIPPRIEEHARPGERPEQLAVRLAEEKAGAVASGLGADDDRFVLGADTIVVIGQAVLGKPDDAEHAVALLSQLVGRTHRVITGVALVEAATLRVRSLSVSSRVSMRAASEAEVRAYVSLGEALDKAGAYALQGEGGRRFVTSLEGSESNVIGLPIDETLALLQRAGLVKAEACSDPGDRGSRGAPEWTE